MSNRFSSNIKKIRKDNHLSQEELAEQLGVSRQAISKWESGVAYPEMDKIIQLCETFHFHIDDLLYRDIKEVKGEEESKSNLNKYFDSFLKFITDSVNLFSSMSFRNRLKCFFEQVMIGIVLFFIFGLFYAISGNIFSNIFRTLLPDFLFQRGSSFFEGIFFLFAFFVSIMIMVSVFKTRYLDYYHEFQKENDLKNFEAIGEEDAFHSDKKEGFKHKIFFQKKENKIIIRDPKHSEYRFMKALWKLIVLVIKFFALCFFFGFCLVLIFLFCFFVASFSIWKSGVFFLGILGMLLSCSVIDIIFLLVLFNFIFDRKNNKKMIIWNFIISLIVFGMSSGLVFLGSLKFDIFEEDYSEFVTKSMEVEMNEKLFLDNPGVVYVEADISNVRLEYRIYPLCEAVAHPYYDGIYVSGYCSNPMALMRDFIKKVNQYQLISISNEVRDITVYASHENILKLQENYNHFLEEEKDRDYLQSMLEEKNDLIREYEDQILELEDKIQEYEENEEE